jgi:hypothetical protein
MFSSFCKSINFTNRRTRDAFIVSLDLFNKYCIEQHASIITVVLVLVLPYGGSFGAAMSKS